jgi:hypothetical protein
MVCLVLADLMLMQARQSLSPLSGLMELDEFDL